MRSPITGRVIARNAQPGLLAQPGVAPAPYAVADLGNKWMLANVTETEIPLFKVGQPVRASMLAYTNRLFEGKISRVGASVDPNTHRQMLRCVIADPQNELRPGMLATFVIQIKDPIEATAIPVNGIVRNGDGTMVAWVTTDQRHFVQKMVKIGLQNEGKYQVLDGLQVGQRVVTDGAVFISNILYAPPSD